MASIKSFFITIFLASRLASSSPVMAVPHRRNANVVTATNETNTVEPSVPVFPRKASTDAPYSVNEEALRGAIHIPSTFEYGSGSKTPVVLVPGTAVSSDITWANGFAKLLGQTDYADPVWLNIPGDSLGDIQITAEYVAYAINYIAGVSKDKKLGVVSWSQGGINTQWAFKYWPSTVEVVTDLIALAADFNGTVLAPLICSPLTGFLCTPAIIQQENGSNLITALRSNGGDSAFVPTTTFYSDSDEIVQPQNGTSASAYLLDGRSVGVTNNQVQTVCGDKNMVVLHEGALYNALAWGLIQDALTHDGPGQVSRLDVASLCNQESAPGIDGLAVEAAVAVSASTNILESEDKTLEEPAVASYAL
ncbi:hypothetical protein BJY01DRAFT_250519 [Aspergillus pseudoustus]|uniref:Alpha/Beta hydrolase protein n=1 Tax=Aspergillus pseudoustus TaxID=1810923 RepID=A0ABR4JH98_9EURO